MSAKSKAFENGLMKLIFQAVEMDGFATSPVGGITNLWIGLHTADPGETGNQTTSEVNYTGYARVAIARSPAGWNVVQNAANPVVPVEFGEMSAGTAGTATYATIGTLGNGTGMVLYRGALTPPIPFSVGVTPRMRTTTTVTED